MFFHLQIFKMIVVIKKFRWGIFDAVIADFGTTQLCEICTNTQILSNIMRQTSDVSPFATTNDEANQSAINFNIINVVNGRFSGFHFDFFASSR